MLSIARFCVKQQGFILQLIQANTKGKYPIGDFYLFPSEILNNYDGLEDLLALTCKQSSEVMTMRGHLDWHASSNGKKYLSASMKFVLDLMGGNVLEPDLPSPLGGLGEERKE